MVLRSLGRVSLELMCLSRLLYLITERREVGSTGKGVPLLLHVTRKTERKIHGVGVDDKVYAEEILRNKCDKDYDFVGRKGSQVRQRQRKQHDIQQLPLGKRQDYVERGRRLGDKERPSPGRKG